MDDPGARGKGEITAGVRVCSACSRRLAYRAIKSALEVDLRLCRSVFLEEGEVFQERERMGPCLAGQRCQLPHEIHERDGFTLVLHDVGSGASWIELDMELEDDLRASRGDRTADGETGLAAPEPGRLCDLSMGARVF